MKIGKLLGTEKVQAWVPFPDDPTGEVLINYVNAEDIRRISKAATKRRWDKKTNAYVEEYDAAEGNRLLGEAAIADWKGFDWEDGNPIPFTPENRDILMAKWSEFNKFIAEAALSFSTFIDREREDAKKKQ